MRKDTTAEIAHAAIDAIMKRCEAFPDGMTKECSPHSDEVDVAEFPDGCPKTIISVADFYKEQRHLIRVVGQVIGVVEDVIGALLATKTLSLTDLPPAAQQFVRQDILPREPLGGILLDDNDVRFP